MRILLLKVVISIMCSLVMCEQDSSSQQGQKSTGNHLIVISTTNDLTQDSFSRFNQSVQANQLRLEFLKDNSKEISSYQNGISSTDPMGEMRRKFEMLRDKLSLLRNDDSLVVMLIDGSNTIINGNEERILTRFNDFKHSNGTRILFSADVTCWPDISLANKYPAAKSNDKESGERTEKRYLDSRSLIGSAQDLWAFLELSKDFKGKDQIPLIETINYDFQLYSTHVYLSEDHRKRLGLELDHVSGLFENLDSNHGSVDQLERSKVELEFVDIDDDGRAGDVNLRNLIHNTRPLVVHGSSATAKVSCLVCVQSSSFEPPKKTSDDELWKGRGQKLGSVCRYAVRSSCCLVSTDV
jgi:hypothetical protein